MVTATPAVAAYVAYTDKVDGKHAVAAGATVEERAGKLVATDRKGRLPNIIRKATDSNKLDGLDSGTLLVTTGGGTAATNPIVPGCTAESVFDHP